MASSGPTANASRYVGSGAVLSNCTRLAASGNGSISVIGALLATVADFGATILSVNGVLKRGSSNPGNAPRASIGSNWVNAYQSSPTFTRNNPSSSSLK